MVKLARGHRLAIAAPEAASSWRDRARSRGVIGYGHGRGQARWGRLEHHATSASLARLLGCRSSGLRAAALAGRIRHGAITARLTSGLRSGRDRGGRAGRHLWLAAEGTG